MSQILSEKIQNWYASHARNLPWRQSKDPYQIWISEVMLQQTTVAAVIPYFERFKKRFPNVQSLAKAPLDSVLEYWAGLGYYSRARNLHKAAQQLAKSGFPKNYSALLDIPGFGPYTSRAVSSIAFGERTGVVDGNVIRVLSRVHGLSLAWWENKSRTVYQEHADSLVQTGDPSLINQALMDLGATICTPTKPACLICPWQIECVAFENGITEKLPIKRPKKQKEIWHWQVSLSESAEKILLEHNTKENWLAPVLKNSWIFPGTWKKMNHAPKRFHGRHAITHHEIYFSVEKSKYSKTKTLSEVHKLVERKNLKKINPSSLLQKIIAASEKI